MTEGRTRRRIVRRATSPAGPPADQQNWQDDFGASVLTTADLRSGQTDAVLDTVEADGRPMTDVLEEQLAGRSRPALDLLIWDAPNIDMTLSTVIGARPT